MNRQRGAVALIACSALSIIAGVAVLSGSESGSTSSPPAATTPSASQSPATDPGVITTPATEPPATSTTSPTTTPGTTTTSTTTTSTTTTSTTTTSTTTVVPTTTIPDETPETFLDLFVAGIQSGDADFLVGRLHPEVFVRWDAEQCATVLAAQGDPTFELTLRELIDLPVWTYDIGGAATDIDDVLGVEVQRQQAGETLIQELHWKLLDGQWTWFTDCTPL